MFDDVNLRCYFYDYTRAMFLSNYSGSNNTFLTVWKFKNFSVTLILREIDKFSIYYNFVRNTNIVTIKKNSVGDSTPWVIYPKPIMIIMAMVWSSKVKEFPLGSFQ